MDRRTGAAGLGVGVRADAEALQGAFVDPRADLAEQYGRWPIFEHCMPFNTSRLWDELSGVERPRIWTARRDREVWDELQG